MAPSRVYYPQARAILQVVLDGFGDTARDTAPIVIPCLPKSLTIQRNSYQQADAWEVMLEVGDLPIDPQLIRSGAIELYLFQLSESEQRVVGRQDPLAGETDGHAARDKFVAGNRPLIVGLFDRAGIKLSESGGWVTLAGQDYTAHLISLQWPPLPNGRARRIPTGQRLDELLSTLLSEADPGGRLSVDVRGVDPSELPVVGAQEIRSNKRGIPVTGDTNYWEVMYKVATRHGFILYVDGLDVVLAKPRNLGAESADRIKRMAWGVNLASLEVERDLGKEQSPTIVVRGFDPKTRAVVEVEYPEGEYHRAAKAGDKAKVATKTSTHTSKRGKVTTTVRNRDEYQIVPVYGVTDRAVMRRMAETYYHLRGRAERRVIATTNDLRDMRESDMLSLTAGDAVTVVWDDFNRALLSNPQMTAAQKMDHLVSRGFNTQVATEIVSAYARLQALDRPLRFKEGTISWDTDAGVTIEMELADFIVIDGVRDPLSGRPGAVDRLRDKLRGAAAAAGEAVTGWSKEREAAERRRRGDS